MLNRVLLTLVFFSFNLLSAAQANLIESDIYADGSNKGFTIEGSNLQWMDFGINNHLSYQEVITQLGFGGEYEGWQLATREQVYNMWNTAFAPFEQTAEYFEFDNNFGFNQLHTAHKGTLYDNVFAAMGYNQEIIGRNGLTRTTAVGVFKSHPDFFSYIEYGQSANDFDQFYDYATLYDEQNYTDTTSFEVSTLLVRSTSVPEPSTWLIILIGMIGCIKLRKPII